MAFPTKAVLDNFTGTNGTDLQVYSANWASPPTGGVAMEIQSNSATGTGAGSNNTAFWVTSFGPNTEVYATVSTKPADGSIVLLFSRGVQETSLTTADGYCLRFAPAAGTDAISIQRLDNGAQTTIGAAISQEVSAGDAIGMEIEGSTLRAYYKASGGSWAQLGTDRTDTTYSAAGKAGMFTTSTAVRLDDFGAGTMTHTASGSLAGSAGVVAGTATHYTKHTASGDLAGSAGVVTGSASRWHAFSASGVLEGSAGVIAGTASVTTGGEHSADGALSGPAGVIEGTATHYILHTATGELVGPAGVISGTTEHYILHSVTGEMSGPAGVISGTSMHSGSGASMVVSGGGGGTQKKRKKLAVLEVDGKEYVIPADDVQSFLNSVVKTDKKKIKKQEEKKQVPAIAPAVRIVEVAPEVEQVVVQKVDKTNELLLSAWSRAIERELEEEEELIWLLVA